MLIDGVLIDNMGFVLCLWRGGEGTTGRKQGIIAGKERRQACADAEEEVASEVKSIKT